MTGASLRFLVSKPLSLVLDFIESESKELELFFVGVEAIGNEIVRPSEGEREGNLKNDKADILEPFKSGVL